MFFINCLFKFFVLDELKRWNDCRVEFILVVIGGWEKLVVLGNGIVFRWLIGDGNSGDGEKNGK